MTFPSESVAVQFDFREQVLRRSRKAGTGFITRGAAISISGQLIEKRPSARASFRGSPGCIGLPCERMLGWA